jgi:hypothetical protein
MRVRNCLVIGVLGVLAVGPFDAWRQEAGHAAPAPKRRPPPYALALEIKPGADGEGVGEVRIVNRGTKPVTLVQPGDGSGSHWRTPRVGWSVLKVGAAGRHPDTVVPMTERSRCGLYGPVQAKEVFTLAPGKSVALEDRWSSPEFPGPGIYRVVFYYENDPACRGTWNHDDEALLRQVRGSFPCLLKSNELTLTVRAKKK